MPLNKKKRLRAPDKIFTHDNYDNYVNYDPDNYDDNRPHLLLGREVLASFLSIDSCC